MAITATRPVRREKKIRKKGSPLGRPPAASAANKVTAAGAGPQSAIVDRPSQVLPPALRLLPYQRRWIEDQSPLKIVVKARQIGYSFASTLRVVFECLKRKTTWILLSKGERQSRLLMEKVQEHIQSCGIVAQACESEYFEGTTIKQLETRFPNGSVIYGLPANPDTARGYSGNVTLDEFAFHADAAKIYSALYPSTTRGYSLEVISTPNRQQGKFYELARQAGLTDESARGWVLGAGEDKIGSGRSVPGAGGKENSSRSTQRLTPSTSSLAPRTWSPHYCDIYEAVRQGLKIDLQLLRAGCTDDAAWRQEFGCQFVSTAENFFSPELLAACLNPEARTDTPLHLLEEGSRVRFADSDGVHRTPEIGELGVGGKGSGFLVLGARATEDSNPSTQHLTPSTQFFLGIDIGRRHDRTVFWIDETVNRHSSFVLGPLSSVGSSSPVDFNNRPRAADKGQMTKDERQRARVSITRQVRVLSNTPFDQQLAYARELLSLRGGNGAALICRAAIDATGMGAPLAESLAQEFGPRVEPVVFTAAVKEDLAHRTKRRMESGLSLLPDSRDIRRAFSAVKKYVTVSGNLRFDAERTDAGHSDEFWAKALADLAAEIRPAARFSDGYLAGGKPLISPNAFIQTDVDWAATLTRAVF